MHQKLKKNGIVRGVVKIAYLNSDMGCPITLGLKQV
jgi:hypothetical protein